MIVTNDVSAETAPPRMSIGAVGPVTIYVTGGINE